MPSQAFPLPRLGDFHFMNLNPKVEAFVQKILFSAYAKGYLLYLQKDSCKPI